MSNFTCHNPACKASCKRIIAFEGNLYCENCYKVERPRPSYLHQKAGNPHCPKMTVTKERIIDNRVKAKDGSIIDRRTGRRTEY